MSLRGNDSIVVVQMTGFNCFLLLLFASSGTVLGGYNYVVVAALLRCAMKPAMKRKLRGRMIPPHDRVSVLVGEHATGSRMVRLQLRITVLQRESAAGRRLGRHYGHFSGNCLAFEWINAFYYHLMLRVHFLGLVLLVQALYDGRVNQAMLGIYLALQG